MGRRPHRRRPVHPARLARHQIEAAVPDKDTEIVLYCRSGARSAVAAAASGAGLHERRQWRGGIQDGRRTACPSTPPTPDARPAAALQPPPADPRGRDGGPGEAARIEGPADRRGRARQPGGAVPRRGRRRHARHRRLRRRRGRNLQRQVIHSTERLGVKKVDSARTDDRGAQPRRRRSSPTTRCSWRTTSSG